MKKKNTVIGNSKELGRHDKFNVLGASLRVLANFIFLRLFFFRGFS